MELRPCPACMRHVTVHEVTCPFCAATLRAAIPRGVMLRGRLTRAAVFGAVLAAGACGKTEDAAPVPAHGSADPKELEHVLDEPFSGPARAPSDAAADAAAIAVAIDAGVPPDAGPDAADIARRDAERKRKEAERRRQQQLEAERHQKQLDEQLRQQQQQQLEWQQHHNAKPYGAPPARRRVV